jgi:hypothetical protein
MAVSLGFLDMIGIYSGTSICIRKEKYVTDLIANTKGDPSDLYIMVAELAASSYGDMLI